MSETAPVFFRSPQCPHIEVRTAVNSTACYHTHSHDEFSFGIIDTGSARYRNGSSVLSIGAGSTVTINPGMAHSCNPHQGDWSYRMLFVDTAWLGQIQAEFDGKYGSDYREFSTKKSDDLRVFAAIQNFYSTLMSTSMTLEVETEFLALVPLLFAVTDAESPAKNGSLRAADTAREMIMDRLADNLTLSDFSAQTGLSRYQLIRSFKARFGQTPHAYQLDSRIKRAKQLLRSGQALSSVALELGFADQAHFQRHFKRRLAVTPKFYQTNLLGC